MGKTWFFPLKDKNIFENYETQRKKKNNIEA